MQASTGTTYPYLQFGKPTAATYKFAVQVLEDRIVEVFEEVCTMRSSELRTEIRVLLARAILTNSRLVPCQVHPTVVIHTASPVHGLAQSKTRIYYEVNETGTKNVVSACLKTEAKKLVYTSSVGVVWTGGTPLEGVCEDAVQTPKRGYDAYHHTKALGEAVVLEAGKRGELEVVVLRPCGMTG